VRPTILVTGATGKTGAPSAKQLLARGFPVRALVHREDARSEALRRAGAEVVLGSLESFEDLAKAMDGVQRAYFCPPLSPGSLRRATTFATAAEAARLEVVVALSQWLADSNHRALHAREKWLAGHVFDWLPNVDVITVNPGWFADNYFAALEGAAQLGLFAMPLGDGTNAPPSNEDVARVIVGLLADPAPHLGRSYRPTGPSLLAPEEIAATLGKILGRRVKYQNAPLPLFLKVAKALGLPDYVIAQLYVFLQDYQRNSFGVGAPTDAVVAVGGSPPEDFEAITRRYVATSRVAKRTVVGTLRALWNVVTALATPSPDLVAIARRLELPELPRATLAADSATWRESHQSVEAHAKASSSGCSALIT
jgi:uncharacterized protein YbjT (DUF2867 family)